MLKLIESYRDDAARPRHRNVASLGNAPMVACGLETDCEGRGRSSLRAHYVVGAVFEQ